MGMISLNAEGKQVIVLAVDEARRLNHSYIGTEHMVLGLVRQNGVAADVLEELGIMREQIRIRIILLLDQ